MRIYFNITIINHKINHTFFKLSTKQILLSNLTITLLFLQLLEIMFLYFQPVAYLPDIWG